MLDQPPFLLLFFVFLAADPGPLRTLAYNLMLIGGISTLLFNGNPLLRFDGYFVFADLMESPNLGQRSTQYFWHLVRRTILRDLHDLIQRGQLDASVCPDFSEP